MHFLQSEPHKSARAPLASAPRLGPVATLSQCQCPSGSTIENLSNKVLLDIFRYYLDDSPPLWPRLVHTCRKWRRLVFASHQALRLQLFCTYGTPVLRFLDCWPTLPVIVVYGGSPGLDPPNSVDEDNIVTALKQSGRVTSIRLTATNTLLEKLAEIERPFSELEDFVLLSQDVTGLSLPSAFGWCTRLRSLSLTRITFFALPQLLYSSRNITDLQLHEVPNPWLFSPEALTDALSGMAQLRSLSLHFPPTSDYFSVSLSSRRCIVLPSLARLNFQGIATYLNGLVAGIDTPRLRDIEVTFFIDSITDLSNLSKFVDRTEMLRSHRLLRIESSESAVSLSLIQPGPTTCIKFQIFCEQLSEQLSSISRILIHFPALLVDMEDLHISATRLPIRADSLDRIPWLESLESFTGVKWLHVAGNLSIDIVHALQQPGNLRKAVVPALQKLYIQQPGPSCAPLRETVVSLMVSRRLSGYPIEVEYEQLRQIGERHGTVGCFSQQVMIEILSDDILFNIFRHCLDVTPRIWPTLAEVCHRWRQIILTSPLGLNLRLHCTHGTPVLEALSCWTTLPIVVLYGGVPNLDPPAVEDDDNIITALKQSGRVSSVSLTVTSSLIEKLSAISESFSELEELTLLSRDNMQLTLPSTFQWGPRLRTLHSTRIAFPSPSFPQLLSPCQHLVDLQLHEIPSTGYFSPEEFAHALSGMTQLQSLTLHLLSFPRRRSYLSSAPPLLVGERIVLPALIRFKYRGTSKYLDIVVARIDAPCLGDIDITFFCQPTMDASQLGRFIGRIEVQTSLTRAYIETSAHAISISFTNWSASTPLKLQISCKQVDWQLSCMAQVCDQFSSFLFRVEELRIGTTQSPSGQENVAGEQWVELVRSFGGARDFWMANELTTGILGALVQADRGDAAVLPTLRIFRVEKPMEVEVDEPLWDALHSFITSRSLSGRPVTCNVSLLQCHICHARFSQQPRLDLHLAHKHAFRMMCSHCKKSVYSPGNDHIFWTHLKIMHPEVEHTDPLLSNPLSADPSALELESLRHRHTSLLAPKVIASSTTVSPNRGL